MRPLPRLLLLLSCWLLLPFSLSPSLVHARSICRAETAGITITLTGFTRPQTFLDLTPEVTGRCTEVRADVGDPVPDDTVFARIDSTFTILKLQTNALARTRTEKSLAFEKKQVGRYRKLVTTKASAQTRLEELELQYEQTLLSLQELETQQEQLRETLARHTVHAPAGWLVIERQIELGEWVRAGQAVARVGDYQHLVVPVVLRPEELHYLRSADTFSLFIVDNEIRGTGTLRRIAPNFDPVTRKTKADIALSDATLEKIPDKRGGLRVEIQVPLKDPMHAFLLPAEAVEERYEENWLTRENGQTFRVIVLGPELSPAADTGKRLRIVSKEIKEGDRFQCRESSTNLQSKP
ncbi:MAG: efflux RND transporter periplasmic adaptor subunit [Desulfobulbaceae bacterium]|nr:efflux RND transporter periplasmic adaptor subunit [Desulfobulbaceae bacterium]